jgi:cytidine deaminase
VIDDAGVDALLDAARRAREHAYAPYSGFAVGAAVETDAGTFAGANVENASYPVGMCAERAAAAAAVSGGATRIGAVVVATRAVRPTPPCGMCRQFLYEFGPGMVVVSEGGDGTRRRWRLNELLPDAFGPEDLDRSPVAADQARAGGVGGAGGTGGAVTG